MRKSQIAPFLISILLVMAAQGSAWSQTPLENCATQFIDGRVENAPTIYSSTPDVPYGSNRHLCYRDDGVTFFALEYWPEEFAPRWAAYKISPANYGERGCNTYTRQVANCYFNEDTWDGFLNCKSASDPFHADYMLGEPKLGPGDFSNTGHDRGHIAPRQAFSWHVCGTYQTFSMANMSPQSVFLNQDIWAYLEQQVLTWGIDEGPVYVVSGTTYRPFPYQHFQVYQDGVLHADNIYQVQASMQDVVRQHHANFQATEKGDLLRPKRDANPDKVSNKAKDMRMPTGYFKVVYRPALNGEPAHAIGFLLPHSFENLNMAAEQYSNLSTKEALWLFVSRIDLIEETSGVRFPGVPPEMKSIWGDDWFFEHDRSRSDIRATDCGLGTPQGVLANSTKEERLSACIDHLR